MLKGSARVTLSNYLPAEFGGREGRVGAGSFENKAFPNGPGVICTIFFELILEVEGINLHLLCHLNPFFPTTLSFSKKILELIGSSVSRVLAGGIAHSDALKLIKIDVDRQFLLNQRLPGRPGCLLGKDIKGIVKENRNVQRKLNESNRKDNYNKERPSTSSLNFIQIDSTSEDKSPESSDSSEIIDEYFIRNRAPSRKKKMPGKN
ncbi:hypothetical protein QTP88_022556 [Uroleucon formosanum]